MDVDLAGIPHELQSGPNIAIEFGGIPKMTHKQSLRRKMGGARCVGGWLARVGCGLVTKSQELSGCPLLFC